VVPCAHLAWAEACALAGVGALFATSTGAGSRAAVGAVWALGGRLGLSYPLGERLAVRAFVDVIATPDEPRYAVGGNEVFRLSPVGGDLGVGVEARIW
jgi:hypothetical protein